ncbi:hypothetical protein [Fibrobacter succinogenes]|uniref:hypothetical protein n=1 Tax=Fibrobacter succinogenes TaxID=833 RepID=UPI0013D7CF91|nr:hypothetical protein [Fibrobacter succinogenes]
MAFWFIPVAVGLGVTGAVNRWRKTKLEIAVLGPEASGKTTLIELLSKGKVENRLYRQTGIQEICPEFEAFWTKPNMFFCTDITVNSDSHWWQEIKNLFPDIGKFKNNGQDIPGGEEIVNNYEKLMEKKDFVFFLINVKEFFDKEDVSEDVLARLEFLSRHYENDMSKFIVLATHIDKVGKTEEEIKNGIRNKVKDKPYSNIIGNLKCINLVGDSAGDDIRKCFGEYGKN